MSASSSTQQTQTVSSDVVASETPPSVQLVLEDDEEEPVGMDTAVDEGRSTDIDGVVDAVDLEDVDESESVAARSVVVVDMPTSSRGDDTASAGRG